MGADAAIGALGSVVTAGVNNYLADQNAEKAYERQKKLMALQQQYAVENWNREVNYNDPKEQMKRLKNAGLNPNLVYGNGSVGLEAPSTAAPTAPSAPMAQTVPMSNFVTDAVMAAKGIQEAKKANSETIGQEIENKFQAETLQERIKSVALQNGWTDQQTKKAVEETANLQQEWSMLVAQQNILSTERQIRDKELANWDERFKKEMRSFDDQHKLSYQEYKRLQATYDDFVRLAKANADKAEYDALLSQLLYESDKDFKNWERSAGILAPFLQLLVKICRQ